MKTQYQLNNKPFGLKTAHDLSDINGSIKIEFLFSLIPDEFSQKAWIDPSTARLEYQKAIFTKGYIQYLADCLLASTSLDDAFLNAKMLDLYCSKYGLHDTASRDSFWVYFASLDFQYLGEIYNYLFG